MKLRELVPAYIVLSKLQGVKMPFKLAYAVGKNLSRIEDDVKRHDAARLEILEKYGEKQEDGSYRLIDVEGANAEYQDVIDTESDFAPYTVPMALMESLELTPGEVEILGWMFTTD